MAEDVLNPEHFSNLIKDPNFNNIQQNLNNASSAAENPAAVRLKTQLEKLIKLAQTA